jgi:hypothetical protein
MTSIALGIPHCGWDEQRVTLVRALLADLGGDESPSQAMLFSEPGPAHCSVWSQKMWAWWEESGCDYCLTIQDDARVAPNFWPLLRAMLTSVPDQLIGLQAIHPAGKALAEVGKHRWYTTRDMLAGVSYVMPRNLVLSFNRWRATCLRPGSERRLNEDNLVALFAVDAGLRIWHPLPTLVDHHDPGVPIRSNYGHGGHGNRNATWTWIDEAPSVEPSWWKPEGVPHLGRFYQQSPQWLARNCTSWTEEEMHDFELDLVQRLEIRDRRPDQQQQSQQIHRHPR